MDDTILAVQYSQHLDSIRFPPFLIPTRFAKCTQTRTIYKQNEPQLVYERIISLLKVTLSVSDGSAMSCCTSNQRNKRLFFGPTMSMS